VIIKSSKKGAPGMAWGHEVGLEIRKVSWRVVEGD
jgi:hypothetical protein